MCSRVFVVRCKPSGLVAVFQLSFCKRSWQVIRLLGLLPTVVAVVSLLVALLLSSCLGLQTMVCKRCNHWYHHHRKALVIASLLVVSLLSLQDDMIICAIVVGLLRLWLSRACQLLSLSACQGCIAAVVMIALLPLLLSLAASSLGLLTLLLASQLAIPPLKSISKKLSKMLRSREDAVAVS